MKYEIGQELKVIGEEATDIPGLGAHNFEIGTKVTVLESAVDDFEERTDVPNYCVEDEDGNCYWVHEDDLEATE
jgi:hypothetical protein